jgi:hypothetical protein
MHLVDRHVVDGSFGFADASKQRDRALPSDRRERRATDEVRDLGQRPVAVAVRLRVSGVPVIVSVMIVIVRMVMPGVAVMVGVPVGVPFLTGVLVIGVVARTGDQRDVRRVDPGTQNAGRRQIVSNPETAERLLQRRQRQAGVEQRAQNHVPGRTRKTIEVHHPRHESHPDSFIEQ